MKDFIKQLLREGLLEGKQIGLLYYFTRYGRLTKVIQNNFILTSTIQPYVSFTRNKYMNSDTISDDVKITLDGDLLSNMYRITPFAQTNAGYGRGGVIGDESEERIDLSKYPKGINIKKAIIGIDINTPLRGDTDYDEISYGPPSLKDFNELIGLLRNTRTPFNFHKNHQQIKK